MSYIPYRYVISRFQKENVKKGIFDENLYSRVQFREIKAREIKYQQCTNNGIIFCYCF